MSDLPAIRVSAAKAFESVGTDFGGPFSITLNRSRGSRSIKAYLCLFVCLSTKAVHLEAVTDLSTDAFLAALRRFVARRGRCTLILSDCGTNYKGAAHYLNEVRKYLSKESAQQPLQRAAAAMNISWQFNPPSAPHFGGIWEAGIKSAKKLISRVIGKQLLTFEEITTVFAEVEAQLNSRPLCPLSNDPADLVALTPGHFLVGEPLVTLADYEAPPMKYSLSQRWRLVSQIKSSFWARWRLEYLNTLQLRQKWYRVSPTIAVSDLVIIKDDNSPPLQWRLGRVVELRPGRDDVARVAIVQTKLCVFPIDKGKKDTRLDDSLCDRQHGAEPFATSEPVQLCRQPRRGSGDAVPGSTTQ